MDPVWYHVGFHFLSLEGYVAAGALISSDYDLVLAKGLGYKSSMIVGFSDRQTVLWCFDEVALSRNMR